MFEDFDTFIKEILKCKERGYAGSKPNPEDWVDLTEFDSDLDREFNKIYEDEKVP